MSPVAQDLGNLPLFDIQDLAYKGAFRLPHSTFGASSLNYSEGPIAYNAQNHSLFVVGHSHDQAIAEFAIPVLDQSVELSDLPMAASPLQSFASILDRAPNGNPQNLDRIGGLLYNNQNGEGKLIVNAYEYYDAPADNSQTTLIINQASDLSNSTVTGLLTFQGGAGHTSGWMSSVPLDWQNLIGTDHITGQSSGIPIIARTSVGPSAFSFDMDDLLNATDEIETEKLLDFDLGHPLGGDLENSTGTNDVWTHLSRVVYGFILPGTRTYFTIGYSGGHTSGVCYKCIQNSGSECGGYCAPDVSDYYHYYWLWDMNDLMKVKAGLIEAYDVLPYDYGEFTTAFQSSEPRIGGASFDPNTGDLYVSIQRADTSQGIYANPPVILVYSTNLVSSVDAYLGNENISLYPNPTQNTFELRGLISDYTIQVLDVSGNVFQTYTSTSTKLDIDISTLPEGMYFIHIQSDVNGNVTLQKILKQ